MGLVISTTPEPTPVVPNDTVFNILQFSSAAADGTTDVSPLIEQALELMPTAETLSGAARSAQGGSIYFPPHPEGGRYYFSSQVEIPADKNVEIVLGSGVVLTGNGSFDHVFYRRSSGVFRYFSIEGPGTFLDVGACLIENQSRGQHLFKGFSVHNSPHYGITLMSGDDINSEQPYGALGGSGGIVNGQIESVSFTDCYGAVQCRGHQSDNWLVLNCNSTRSKEADFQIASAAWRLWSNTTEQRASVNAGGNFDAPWINIYYTQAVANVDIFNHRFGNEFADYVGTADDTAPPRAPLIYGIPGEVTEASMPGMRLRDSYFRGHAGDTSLSSARHAIEWWCTPERARFDGNDFFGYHESLIGLYSEDGRGNRLDLNNRHGYVSDRTTPLFNKPPSTGDLGAWEITPNNNRLISAENRQLVRNTDSIEDSVWWSGDTGGNAITVAKNVTGPSGLPNSAYTLTKTGTEGALANDPEQISLADAWAASTAYSVGDWVTSNLNIYECTSAGTSGSDELEGSLPSYTDGTAEWKYIGPAQKVCVYACFRSVPGSAVQHVRLDLGGLAPDANSFKLTPEWNLVWFSTSISPGTHTLRILLGEEGQTDTGTVEMAYIGMVPGEVPPDVHIERDSTAERRLPGGWTQLGQNFIGTGSALPTAGDYDFDFIVDDRFFLTGIAGGTDSQYRCTAGGDGGTWVLDTPLSVGGGGGGSVDPVDTVEIVASGAGAGQLNEPENEMVFGVTGDGLESFAIDNTIRGKYVIEGILKITTNNPTVTVQFNGTVADNEGLAIYAGGGSSVTAGAASEPLVASITGTQPFTVTAKVEVWIEPGGFNTYRCEGMIKEDGNDLIGDMRHRVSMGTIEDTSDVTTIRLAGSGFGAGSFLAMRYYPLEIS